MRGNVDLSLIIPLGQLCILADALFPTDSHI